MAREGEHLCHTAARLGAIHPRRGVQSYQYGLESRLQNMGFCWDNGDSNSEADARYLRVVKQQPASNHNRRREARRALGVGRARQSVTARGVSGVPPHEFRARVHAVASFNSIAIVPI